MVLRTWYRAAGHSEKINFIFVSYFAGNNSYIITIYMKTINIKVYGAVME